MAAKAASDDAILVADYLIRFWPPVPDSYDAFQAAVRILASAGQPIPETPIQRAAREYEASRE